MEINSLNLKENNLSMPIHAHTRKIPGKPLSFSDRFDLKRLPA